MWQKSYNKGVVYRVVNPKRGICLLFNIQQESGCNMKERVFKYEIGILFVYLLLSLLLIAAVFVWGIIYSPEFQTAQATVQPAAAPADIGELTTRVENLENDQAYNLKVFEWKLDQKLLIFGWVALFISFAAGFLGLRTYNDLDKVIKERVNSALEKALYQLDPTNLPIHIYQGRIRRDTKKDEEPYSAARKGLPDVEKRLELTGLLNVGRINYLSNVSQTGITVIPIDDIEDEKDFIKTIKDEKIKFDPEEAGFILYAPQGKDAYHIKSAQYEFPNTVIATMPATVASMVLVVGRGLKNREGISIKKEDA
jgi:hypothetical protein